MHKLATCSLCIDALVLMRQQTMEAQSENQATVSVGQDLTLADVTAVAREHARVELGEAARARMRASRAWVEGIMIGDRTTVYGINTGFGIFANVRISPTQSRDLMRRLILSHAAGVGEPLPEDSVRAALLIRANALAQGYSGVRVEVVETLLEMLNRGVHPVIPAKGSVGASGDLAPLSHLALVLSTDAADEEAESGEAFYHGERVSGKQAMRRAGIPRLVLEAKEGLALNNGTSISTAIAALALSDARNLVENSTIAVALTLEALRGCSAAFDERIQRAGRHNGQQLVATRIRALTRGSRLLDSSDRVQDAYSIRCAPQVIGAASDALEHARQILDEEINAATDNPLIFVDAHGTGQARSGGNFHGAAVASVADLIAIAVAQLGTLSERRTFRLCDAQLNDGLPMMLIEGGGLNSGLMMTQVTAAALSSENKTLAHPDSVDSIPTSANQEDDVPMAANAARHAREVVWNTERIIGIELLAAAQAIDLRLRQLGRGTEMLGAGTRAVHARLREDISFLDRDRILFPDIERAAALVHSGEIVREVSAW
jgi:histidine ammonia-lyase